MGMRADANRRTTGTQPQRAGYRLRVLPVARVS